MVVPQLALDTEKLAALEKTEPRKILERIPDLVEVVTAYRAWVVNSEKLLGGIGGAGGHDWIPKKKNEAQCKAAPTSQFWSGTNVLMKVESAHPAPEMKCSCGFWGFKNLDLMTKAVNAGGYAGIRVLGKVSMWGKIVECENGFRSQFAYPAELWAYADNSEAEDLAIKYGVPVRTL